MYRLFLSPNSYAMTVHALLEEMALPHDLRWVQLFQGRPDPDFVAASPHARVPALVGPEGPVFETGAIALYLAERHDPSLLVPQRDPNRGRFLQWLHYLASTLQPDVMIQFHPEFYFDTDADRRRFMAASMTRLAKVLAVIDAALDPGPWFLGDRRTILDYLLGMQAIWPEIYPATIDGFPNIARALRTLVARPAVRRMVGIHQAKKREQGAIMPVAVEI